MRYSRQSYRRWVLILGAFWAGAARPAPAATTFLADFEQGLDATFAAGDPKAARPEGAKEDDVRLVEGRFGRGVLLGRKVPALSLSYATAKNLSPKAGTLEFWYRPEWNSDFQEADGPDWLKGGTICVFFATSGDPTGLRFLKNQHNWLSFYYAADYKTTADVRIQGNFWTKGQWSYYAVSWDEDEARLFLDGRLVAVSSAWSAGGVLGGRMAVGTPGYGAGNAAWGTFDDIRISDCPKYVSSFPVPTGPLTVEKGPPAASAPAASVGAGKDILFRHTFGHGLAAEFAAGAPAAWTNRELATKTGNGVRLRRHAVGPGDTLAYALKDNLLPALATVEVTCTLDEGAALPAVVFDATELVLENAQPQNSTLRTGMRLLLNKEGRLEWQSLEAGKVLASVTSPKLDLKPGEAHRFGFSRAGANITLYAAGRSVAQEAGAAQPSRLGKYFFLGSTSQGEWTLPGWISRVVISATDKPEP